MKKFLFLALVAVGCGDGVLGMQQEASQSRDQPVISYHSIMNELKNQRSYPYPKCENSNELWKKSADATSRFIFFQNKREVAEELIPIFKNLFCGDKLNRPLIDELENEIAEELENAELSSESLTEVAECLAYMCDELPDAAFDIQNMYEAMGNYVFALLWAMVAYKFGLLGAEETVGRLVLAMKG